MTSVTIESGHAWQSWMCRSTSQTRKSSSSGSDALTPRSSIMCMIEMTPISTKPKLPSI